jgi:hypothetical protein
MSEYHIIVNRQAPSIRNALISGIGQLIPKPLPEIVIGTSRQYRVTVVSNGVIDPISSDPTWGLKVSIGHVCDFPTSGKIGGLVVDSEQTTEIEWDDSPEDLQAKIEALASVGEGNVIVSGVAGRFYRIEFVGGKADTPFDLIQAAGPISLDPESTVTCKRLQAGGDGNNEVQLIQYRVKPAAIQAAWTVDGDSKVGILSANTYEALLALARQSPFQGYIEVSVTSPEGHEEVLALQDATISCRVTDGGQYVLATLPEYLTAGQVQAIIEDELTSEKLVMSGDITVGSGGPRNLLLDPGGANRIVTVSSTRTSPIYFQHDGHANTITLSGVTGSPVLWAGDSVAVMYDGVARRVIGRNVGITFTRMSENSGTEFSVTDSVDVVNINGNDIKLALPRPGKWLVQAGITWRCNGATTSGNTLTIGISDGTTPIADAETFVALNDLTTSDQHLAVMATAPVAIDFVDQVTEYELYAVLTNALDAGAIVAGSAWITATRIGD